MKPRPAFVSAFAVSLLFGALHVHAQDGPKEVDGYILFTKEEVAKVNEVLVAMRAQIDGQQKVINRLRAGTGCT